MSIELHDGGLHRQLLPLTFTRPVGDLRVGLHTLADAWSAYTGMNTGYQTEDYLGAKFPKAQGEIIRAVLAGMVPDLELVEQVLNLRSGEALMHQERPLAFCIEGEGRPNTADWKKKPAYFQTVELVGEPKIVERPWHVFQRCGDALKAEFAMVTKGRSSAKLSRSNGVIGDESLVFLEEGAKVEASILNTTNGPIYIGQQAEVMEGCMVRGPFCLGEHAQLKMGAKIYGPTSIGPHSRIGGEVNNCVVQGYSNKGHDGFLGNSVLGEWCNLGADTNNSNLKNNYGEVRAWSYAENTMVETGLQFCGLIMGDHSKCGINTMLNTGTVVGVCANIFGGDFPAKHVPSFSWGGHKGYQDHDLQKALATAEKVMLRRDVPLDEHSRSILEHIASLPKSKA